MNNFYKKYYHTFKKNAYCFRIKNIHIAFYFLRESNSQHIFVIIVSTNSNEPFNRPLQRVNQTFWNIPSSRNHKASIPLLGYQPKHYWNTIPICIYISWITFDKNINTTVLSHEQWFVYNNKRSAWFAIPLFSQ